MTNKLTIAGLVGFSVLSVSNLQGCKDEEDDSCKDDACRCWDVSTDQAIIDWTELADFNTCCFECGAGKLDCADPNACTYAEAKAAFDQCGTTLPATKPAGFVEPFDPDPAN